MSNPIIKALEVPKLKENVSEKEITRPAILGDKEREFLKDIISRDVPVLVVCDRDTDGTTGLSGGLYASNTGVLPKSWKHTYSWGSSDLEGGSSSTFGVSTEQIEYFYEKNNLSEEDELVVITVDNGSTSGSVQTQLKKKFKNIKFMVTDHHLSTDNTREISDFFVNPTDDHDKGLRDWVVFENNDTNEIQQSHVSGGMLWNLILKEISFATSNPDSTQSPKHQLIRDNPEDFHMRAGLLSQWCDLITFGADWEQAFRVNLKNGNLQKLPIFKHIKALEWSGMTDENWEKSFRNKIRKVSSIINTTKRLDFLLDTEDFEKAVSSMNIDMTDLDKSHEGSLEKTLMTWNIEVREELEEKFPSLDMGTLSPLKFVYLFAIHEGSDRMMEIMDSLAKLKNTLMNINEFDKNSLSNTQFFYTKNPYMRGITSIRCFIDKNRPVLFNMSPEDYSDGKITLKGSFRSDLEEVFDELNASDLKHGSIKLQGHYKAAGATMVIDEGSEDLFYEELNDKISSVIEKENYKDPEREEVSYADIIEASESIINDNNFYVFSQPLKFKIKVKELIDDNNVEVRVSKKTGQEYISHKDYSDNISMLGFSLPKDMEPESYLEIELSSIPNRNRNMVEVLIQKYKENTKPNEQIKIKSTSQNQQGK